MQKNNRKVFLFAAVTAALMLLMAFSVIASAEDSKTPELPQAAYVQGEYIIVYDEEQAQKTMSGLGYGLLSFFGLANDPLNEVLQSYDAQIAGEAGDGIALVAASSELSDEDEEQLIKQLGKAPGVSHIEKNRTVTAFDADITAAGRDTYTDSQWALTSVRAFDSWNLLPSVEQMTFTVRVAVIDTGVDATHPDLAGRVIEGYNTIDMDSTGRPYDPGNTDDDHGHGTHVSGIIAALCNNAIGIQGVAGDIPIEILPIKVLDDSGRGSTYDIIEGIRYAADHGAHIINMSLGSSAASELEQEAVLYAQNKGCLVIAAAGNDSQNVATNYPASYPNVLSVGSVDRDDSRSYFSNYGATLDIAAPGGDILSTVPKSIAMAEKAAGETVYGNDTEGYYVIWSGTSMATPYVAGVAALYKAFNPDASNMDISEHLINTARDVGAIGKDEDTGAGIVDAAAALGEDIVQTAMLFVSPSTGSELYQTVTLRVQVNTSMSITNVRFYLDSLESTPIATVACDGQSSYYETALDTTQLTDGSYEIIAAAYNAAGEQVGDERSIDIQVLNNITDGFTLQIFDPDDEAAADAEINIYGIGNDESCTPLYTAYATDRGFARVKGLDAYDSYLLVYHGSYENAAEGEGIFLYNRVIPATDLGKTLEIRKENAVESSFVMNDIAGEAILAPYMLLELIKGDSVLYRMDAWQFAADSELFVDPADYMVYGYSAPAADSDGAAYYLAGSSTVAAGSSHSFELAASAGTKVVPQFSSGISGRLTLSELTGESSIPFMDGKISGSEIYIMPGTYRAGAELSAEYNDATWALTLSKNTPVVVAAEPVSIDFGTDLSLTRFEDSSSLRTDGDIKYLYRGETLRTVNAMGDGLANSDITVQSITSGHPIFRIYKVEQGGNILVYEEQDAWQLTGSYWRSADDYIDDIPQAGSYLAQLSFDAGPFGGSSVLEIPFELRNISGTSEIDMRITMAASSMPYASVRFFYWDNAEGSWKNSCSTDDVLLADDEGILRGVVIDELTLNSDGINVALVSYEYRKDGYYTPYTYKGFQIVPFAEAEDLTDISLAPGIEMKIMIYDAAGNKKSAPVYFPLLSDGGGRLSEAAPLADAMVNIDTYYGSDKVWLSEGTYEGVYTAFNDAATNYFLTAEDFTAQTGGEIILDGREAAKLQVNIPADMAGYRFYAKSSASANLPRALNFERGSSFWLSKGSYLPQVSVTKGDYLFTLQAGSQIALQNDAVWNIGSSLTPEFKLDAAEIASNRDLGGSFIIEDSNGNVLTAAAKKNGTAYIAYQPTLYVGIEQNAANTEIDYGKFSISAQSYQGEVQHYAYAVYDIGAGEAESEKLYFTVGTGAKLLQLVNEEDFTAIYDGENLQLTAGSSVKGFYMLELGVIPSAAERSFVITHSRSGKQLNSFGLKGVFTAADNELCFAVNMKPGDVISIVLQ